MPSFQRCKSTGQKRQNWHDLAAYTSETIGSDHVHRFVCGWFVQTESSITKNYLFATVTLHNKLFCHRLSDHLHCTNRRVDVGGIDSRIVCPWCFANWMHSRVSAGGTKRAFPLEIGTKNQKFLENLTLAAKSQSIHLNGCNDSSLYLPVWHCRRARFTVLVSCNDAVHSCPLLCLQRGRLGKLGADCSIWSFCATVTRQ